MDEKIVRLINSISQVFVEDEPVCENCILALISGLHVLIEDFPGVGKTTLARAIAEASGLDFGRIQFTPDILPGDVLGMSMWISGKNDFVFYSHDNIQIDLLPIAFHTYNSNVHQYRATSTNNPYSNVLCCPRFLCTMGT